MTPGTALLLAAAPVGKGALVDAAGVLPALAAVPPSTLTGTPAATVVELADPADPQTVLTRIRAAAAAPGPLTVLLAGQLHLDGKQHRLHLALARTTPATLRYTALPWHWLETELAVRRPGTTTLVVDLVTTAEAWQQLRTDTGPDTGPETGPDTGQYGIHLRGTRLYGRIAPPPPRRRLAQPTYLKALTALWRSGSRAPLAQLHEQIVNQGEFGDALLLAAEKDTPTTAPQTPRWGESAPPGPEPDGEDDPLPAILAAAHAGRHSEAAALASMWEGRALRTHGTGSAQAVHWLEVRADLARLDGDPARSCELWMAAADARLARQEAPDAPVVEAAVDRAHHQWQQVTEPQRARELGSLLVALRRHVPGRRAGATDAVEHRLHLLHTDRPRATAPTTPDRTTTT